MNEQFISELKKLLNCFPRSYIKSQPRGDSYTQDKHLLFSCRLWHKEGHNRKSFDVVY